MEQCNWCLYNEEIMRYHNEEWGTPLHDGQEQFEFLMTEVIQYGLSWNAMAQKREIFRQCSDGLGYEKIALYVETDMGRVLASEGMIRSRREVKTVIHNARYFRVVGEELGSSSRYLWGFSKGKTLLYSGYQKGKIPTRSSLSDEASKDLKHRGSRYLGSVTVYSHLQAYGTINDHRRECFRYREIVEQYPVARKRNQ